MTRNLSPDARRRASSAIAPSRLGYVDVFRGLLIAHMGLDHASLMFNSARAAEELAATPPPVFDGLAQFLTRFSGVPVAPGFFFMAGFMVALTSDARKQRGVSRADVTRRLLIRGLVLIAVDAVIMGLPRALMGFYSFMTLSSIGVAIIALAWLRHLSSAVLLSLALAILALHPLIDVSALPVPLQAVLYEPVREGVFRSMYPVFPWIGIVMLGFVVGRDTQRRERPMLPLWYLLAVVSFVLFFVVRFASGYGNAYPHEGIGTYSFWIFSKYPPDLAFLTWSFGCIFIALAVLSLLRGKSIPAFLRPFETFGRVPFFFFVVHFYVLGIGQAILQTKFGLPAVYAIWLLLLLAMIWPCAWYYRKKLDRPSFITRYF